MLKRLPKNSGQTTLMETADESHSYRPLNASMVVICVFVFPELVVISATVLEHIVSRNPCWILFNLCVLIL